MWGFTVILDMAATPGSIWLSKNSEVTEELNPREKIAYRDTDFTQRQWQKLTNVYSILVKEGPHPESKNVHIWSVSQSYRDKFE